jgi:hypothetical protein
MDISGGIHSWADIYKHLTRVWKNGNEGVLHIWETRVSAGLCE